MIENVHIVEWGDGRVSLESLFLMSRCVILFVAPCLVCRMLLLLQKALNDFSYRSISFDECSVKLPIFNRIFNKLRIILGKVFSNERSYR